MSESNGEPAVSEARRRTRRAIAQWCMALITTVLVLAAGGFVPPEHHELVQNLCWIPGAVVVGFFGGDASDSFAEAMKARK